MEFVKGKPERSGNYLVRYNDKEERDDYTTSGGGRWWNVGENGGNDENIEFAPESFRKLGE